MIPLSPAVLARLPDPDLENLLSLGRVAVGSEWLAVLLGSPPRVNTAVGIAPDAVRETARTARFPLVETEGDEPLGFLLAAPLPDGGPLSEAQREAAKGLSVEIARLIRTTRSEALLRQVNAEYRRLTDALPQALLVTNHDGHFHNANIAFTSLLERFSLPPATIEQRGLPLDQLCPEPLARHLGDLRDRITSDGPSLLSRWSPQDGPDGEHFRIVAAPVAQGEDEASGVLFSIEDITERFRMRTAIEERSHALQASRNQLAALLDATENGILMSDSDGIIRHANRAVAHMLRQPADELIGRSIRDVMAEAAERFDEAPNVLQRTNWLYDHPRVVARDNLKTRGSRPLYFERYSAPVYSAIGSDEPPGRIEVFTNLTRSRRLEADLRERNERISRHLARHRALYEVGTNAISELEVPRALEVLTSNMMGLFNADGLAMLLPNGGGMSIASSAGLSPEYLASEQRHYAASAAHEAVRRHEPILISETLSDPRQTALHDALRQEEIRTALYVPLLFRDEEVGVLGLYHRSPYRYAAEEMELLAIFTSQATSILKNTQLYDSVRKGQEELDSIINSMTDGVIALDENERVIFANRALTRLLDLRPGENLIGCAARELGEPLNDIIARVLAEVRHPGAVVRMERELQRPARVLQIVGAPIYGRGQTRGRLILLHDITRLRESEEMKENLIATISHELRTPLTSIVGYSSLVARQGQIAPERRQRWADTLLEKSRQLKSQVDDIFELSTILRRQVWLDLKPVDLAILIAESAERYQGTSAEHSVVLDVEPMAPLVADGARLRRMLDTLISNGIKYSPEGGEVRVTLRGESSWVVLTVGDQGIGIAPEHMERLFEPFYRVDNSTDRAVYGTGLGLSLVQGIVRAHGGEVIVKSRVGEGTTVVVTLPRREQPSGGERQQLEGGRDELRMEHDA